MRSTIRSQRNTVPYFIPFNETNGIHDINEQNGSVCVRQLADVHVAALLRNLYFVMLILSRDQG